MNVIHMGPKPLDPLLEESEDAQELDIHGMSTLIVLSDNFSRFKQLKSVNISGCSLFKLPQSLYALSTLEKLNISKNKISLIPLEIGFLPKLVSIESTENPFWDELNKLDIKTDEKLLNVSKIVCANHTKPPRRCFKPDMQAPRKNNFLLLSYNILAPHTVEPHRYPLTCQKYLDIDYRIPNILEQISIYPASIVCLQEVEMKIFKTNLEPYMKERGFSCFYCPKGRAEGKSDKCKDNIHGEATFIRSSYFNILDTKFIQFREHVDRNKNSINMIKEIKKHDETAIISVLSPKSMPSTVLVVVNVHLFWDTNKEFVRKAQLAIAIENAVKEASNTSIDYDVIIAGDFNCQKNSETIDLLKGNSLGFTDPYETLDVPLEYTWYISNLRRRIDHIFNTSKYIHSIAVLEPYKDADIFDKYLAFPAKWFPSDHIPIAAYFALHKKQAHQHSECTIQIKKPEYKPFSIKTASNVPLEILAQSSQAVKKEPLQPLVLQINKNEHKV